MSSSDLKPSKPAFPTGIANGWKAKKAKAAAKVVEHSAEEPLPGGFGDVDAESTRPDFAIKGKPLVEKDTVHTIIPSRAILNISPKQCRCRLSRFCQMKRRQLRSPQKHDW